MARNRSIKEMLQHGPRRSKDESSSGLLPFTLGDGPSDEQREALRKADPIQVGKIWVDGIGRDLYLQGSTRKSYFLTFGLEGRTKVNLGGVEYSLCQSEQYPKFTEIVGLTHGELPEVEDAHATLEKSAITG